MATKTLSIRVNDEDYRFLSALAVETREDVSKIVRELVDPGRVMLAMDKYRKSGTSIKKAANIAGLYISIMIDVFYEFGVEVNLEHADYLAGLKSLRKEWRHGV